MCRLLEASFSVGIQAPGGKELRKGYGGWILMEHGYCCVLVQENSLLVQEKKEWMRELAEKENHRLLGSPELKEMNLFLQF